MSLKEDAYKRFIKLFNKLNKDNNFSISSEYINADSNISILCKKCNNSYITRPRYIRYKNKLICPYCEENSKMKFNIEIFKIKVKNEDNNFEVLSNKCKNVNSPVKIRHKICGKEYITKPRYFLQGNRCPYCINKKIRNIDELKEAIYKIDKDYIVKSKEFKNIKDEITLLHKKCGLEYNVLANSFLFNNARCPYCKGNRKIGKRKWNDELLKKYTYDEVGNEYEFLESYKSANEKILIKHNKCNKLFYVAPNYFFNLHTRCPYCCFQSTSKPEKDIYNYINSLYNKNIEKNNRTILKNKKELDIYIPDKNIAIEFDGLYWHNEDNKPDDYHINKTIECEEKGIRLIHIFEDEWTNNEKLVKEKLLNELNISSNKEIIHFKKNNFYIKELSIKKKNEFLKKFDIEGIDKSNIRLGLFWKNPKSNKNLLISVMTFCKPKKKSLRDKYNYELSRFSNNYNYIINNSFKLLFEYFKNNYEWNNIITYVDRRWSQGKLFYDNNWKFIKNTKPNYWYENSGSQIRIHKDNFRKSKLKELFTDLYDDNLSEREIMKKTKYRRIYDCGNLVFKYYRGNKRDE